MLSRSVLSEFEIHGYQTALEWRRDGIAFDGQRQRFFAKNVFAWAVAV
jgi:hypothetical protein